jgi:hypothetical protein
LSTNDKRDSWCIIQGVILLFPTFGSRYTLKSKTEQSVQEKEREDYQVSQELDKKDYHELEKQRHCKQKRSCDTSIVFLLAGTAAAACR